MRGDVLNDSMDQTQEQTQAGDTLTIDGSNYPDLQKLQEGDSCSLKIKGTVEKINDDGTIDISPTSIVRTDVNPARETLRSMTPGSRNQKSQSSQDSGQDQGY